MTPRHRSYRALGHRPRRDNDDRGSALIIVLAFVLVVAIVLTSLLREARANFTAVSITKSSQNRVYAANAGIEWGIQELRRGMTVNGAPVCAATGGRQSLGSLHINSRDVDISCQVIEGQTPGAGGWAVFVTDSTGSIRTQSTPSSNAGTIEGSVYNGGGADGWSFLGGTSLSVHGGDVVQQQTVGCTSPGAALAITPSPAYSFGCQATSLATPPPPIALTTLPDLNTAPPQAAQGTTNGNCRVFTPGRYTMAPQLLTGPGASNYLRSGVYFLDDVHEWRVIGSLVGGIPAPGDGRLGSVTPCATETAAETGGHYGVVIVLGGTSRIEVERGGTAELHSYLDPDQPAQPGLSVYQVPATGPAAGPAHTPDPGPWGMHRCTGFGPAAIGSVELSPLASNAELVVHGHVYTPSSRVSAFGGTNAAVSFLGGIVAAGLDLQAAPVHGAANVSIQRSTGQRTISLVATSDRRDDEKVVSTTAVVDIANNPERTATVQSWTVHN